MASKKDLPVVAARVLKSCDYGQPDAVVEIPADEIDAAKVAGLVDDAPDAVAYARTLVP